jgi:hypothetical protein
MKFNIILYAKPTSLDAHFDFKLKNQRKKIIQDCDTILITKDIQKSIRYHNFITRYCLGDILLDMILCDSTLFWSLNLHQMIFIINADKKNHEKKCLAFLLKIVIPYLSKDIKKLNKYRNFNYELMLG